MPLDFTSLIQQHRQRFVLLEAEITAPDLFKDAKRLKKRSRNMPGPRNCYVVPKSWLSPLQYLEENRALANDPDTELAAMATVELLELEAKIPVVRTVTTSCTHPSATR